MLGVCLEEVKRQMAADWLKLNDSKTEFIIFRSKKNLSEMNTVSIFHGESLKKSIGAHLGSTMKMEKKTCINLQSSMVPPLPNKYDTEVSYAAPSQGYCGLDQNNSLLIGLAKTCLA